jgi:hypothetical protein
VHPWTCSAAPVHDPSTGELIGVVDLTAPLRTAHPHTLTLATLAAYGAEAAVRLSRLERAARLRERWEAVSARRRSANVLLDGSGRPIAWRGLDQAPAGLTKPERPGDAVQSSDGRIWEPEHVDGGVILWLRGRTGARGAQLALHLLGNQASARLGDSGERGLRSLELLAVLAMHPEGMSAEQLALALYGEQGKTVTVRAQVHRVRAQFGERLRTQPYRLAGRVRADWLEVGRLIVAGRPREALRAYRGPLLPLSEAPAIAEARGLLEESLRRSILTTAEPELLSRWLAHPSGAGDLAAARALVAVLPPGDPRRAAATATAAAAARRIYPH